MSFLLGPLLGFGASGIQSAVSYKIAKENRDFQERMSNTAHQRQVVDLKSAGLNPILSASLGGGSTPPGNVAQMADMAGSAKQGAEALTKMKLAKSQLENDKEQRKLFQAQARNQISQEASNLFSAKSTYLGNVEKRNDLHKSANKAFVEEMPYVGKGLTIIDSLIKSVTGRK